MDKFSNALKNLTNITHLQTLATDAQALSTKVMNSNQGGRFYCVDTEVVLSERFVTVRFVTRNNLS